MHRISTNDPQNSHKAIHPIDVAEDLTFPVDRKPDRDVALSVAEGVHVWYDCWNRTDRDVRVRMGLYKASGSRT